MEQKLQENGGNSRRYRIIKMARISFLSFLAAIMVLSALLLALELGNAKKIVKGVGFNGINIGGMTEFQAKLHLGKIVKTYEQDKFQLALGDIEWEASAKDLGVKFDFDRIIKEAYKIGRDPSPIAGLKDQLKSFFFGKELKDGGYIDEKGLENYIETNMKMVEIPARDRIIFYNKNTETFWVTPPSNGKIISRQSLSDNLLKHAMANFAVGKIDLSLTIDQPKITEEKAREALALGREIEKKQYVLVYGSKEFPLIKNDLLEIIEFAIEQKNGEYYLAPHFKNKEIKDVVAVLVPSINRKPKNAVLGADENNKIIEVVKSEPGIEMNIEKTALALEKNIVSGEITEIVAEETPPVISKQSMEQLGITDFLGKGESSFAGSPNNRIHNIKVGAAKFNNIFIEKDAEFSFVNTLGPVDDTTGYKPELIIKSNKTVPEYGGGLCQVSTTMFRAAIYSGLKITERYAHAYAVKYYNPAGFDATIYPPHPDLRFVNDTPGKILIQSIVENNEITFNFFGKRDGRETKLIGPVITEKKAGGSMKTYFTQEVYKDGELFRKKIFWSSYKPQALYPTIRNPYE